MSIKFLLALSSLSILTASLHALPMRGQGLNVLDAESDDRYILDRDNSLDDQNKGRATSEAGRSTLPLAVKEEAGAGSSVSDNIETPTSSSAVAQSSTIKTGLDKGELAQIQRLQNEAFFSGNPQHSSLGGAATLREGLERRMNEVKKPTPNTWLESFYKKTPVAGTAEEQLEAQKILIKCSALKLAEPAWKASSIAYNIANLLEEAREATKEEGFQQESSGVRDLEEAFLGKLKEAVGVWEAARASFKKEIPGIMMQIIERDRENGVPVSDRLSGAWREELETLEQNKTSSLVSVEIESYRQELQKLEEVTTDDATVFSAVIDNGHVLAQQLEETQKTVPVRFQSKWDRYIHIVNTMIEQAEQKWINKWGKEEQVSSSEVPSTSVAASEVVSQSITNARKPFDKGERNIAKGLLKEAKTLQNEAFRSRDLDHPSWIESAGKRKELENMMGKVMQSPLSPRTAKQAQNILMECRFLELAEPAWKASAAAHKAVQEKNALEFTPPILKVPEIPEEEAVDCWSLWKDRWNKPEEAATDAVSKAEVLEKLVTAAAVWEEVKNSVDAEFPKKDSTEISEGVISSKNRVSSIDKERENLEQELECSRVLIEVEKSYQQFQGAFTIYKETGNSEEWNAALLQGSALLNQYSEFQQNVPERFKKRWSVCIQTLHDLPWNISKGELDGRWIESGGPLEVASGGAVASKEAPKEVSSEVVLDHAAVAPLAVSQNSASSQDIDAVIQWAKERPPAVQEVIVKEGAPVVSAETNQGDAVSSHPNSSAVERLHAELKKLKKKLESITDAPQSGLLRAPELSLSKNTPPENPAIHTASPAIASSVSDNISSEEITAITASQEGVLAVGKQVKTASASSASGQKSQSRLLDVALKEVQKSNDPTKNASTRVKPIKSGTPEGTLTSVNVAAVSNLKASTSSNKKNQVISIESTTPKVSSKPGKAGIAFGSRVTSLGKKQEAPPAGSEPAVQVKKKKPYWRNREKKEGAAVGATTAATNTGVSTTSF